MDLSEDGLLVSAGQTRSVNSSKKCGDFLSLPKDLVIEIFSRLPAKSVARYRLLSKFWANLLCSQYFIDLFSAKSSARPHILFALGYNLKFSFFSADQPSKNSSDNIALTRLTHAPRRCSFQMLGAPINGLVCFGEFVGKEMKTVIYNSTTGEFLTLPQMKTQWEYPRIQSFLGYDPAEKLFKVLCLVYHESQWLKDHCDQHQVLTLETKELSWRMIVCKPHLPIRVSERYGSEICINGVLYYRATGILKEELIVCFDVRSETFRFISVNETFNKNLPWTSSLTNYDGKLGLLIPEKSDNFVTGESTSFELWVLKDEWSKHVCVLPPLWKKVVGETKLMFVGMIGTNEFVLSTALYKRCYYFEDKLPYIFFYNTEKKTMRRLSIQGNETSKFIEIYMFLNHVENVKLLN